MTFNNPNDLEGSGPTPGQYQVVGHLIPGRTERKTNFQYFSPTYLVISFLYIYASLKSVLF